MNTLFLSLFAALALVLFCTAWAKGFSRRTRRERANPPLRRFAFLFVMCAGFLSGLRNAFSATPSEFALANLGSNQHGGGRVTRKADAAIATRFLLVKIGSDANHIAVAGVADISIGVCEDEPSAAEELAIVQLLGSSDKTLTMVASAAIAAGDFVVAAANGQIRTLPVTTGTYYIVGRALEAAAAAGDQIEVDPIPNAKIVVP